MLTDKEKHPRIAQTFTLYSVNMFFYLQVSERYRINSKRYDLTNMSHRYVLARTP